MLHRAAGAAFRSIPSWTPASSLLRMQSSAAAASAPSSLSNMFVKGKDGAGAFGRLI
jgi:hypothetical protein